MIKRVRIFVLTVVILLAASGCRMVSEGDGDGVEELPWNMPASWEGQILGIPY